jgi:hypothetical protein
MGVAAGQSRLVKQPVHVCATGLHDKVAQSSLTSHWTQSPVLVLQRAVGAWQSLSSTHAGLGGVAEGASGTPPSVTDFAVPPRSDIVFSSLQPLASARTEEESARIAIRVMDVPC